MITFDGELSLEAFDQLWSGDAFLRELSLRGAFHLGRLVRGQESACQGWRLSIAGWAFHSPSLVALLGGRGVGEAGAVGLPVSRGPPEGGHDRLPGREVEAVQTLALEGLLWALIRLLQNMTAPCFGLERSACLFLVGRLGPRHSQGATRCANPGPVESGQCSPRWR